MNLKWPLPAYKWSTNEGRLNLLYVATSLYSPKAKCSNYTNNGTEEMGSNLHFYFCDMNFHTPLSLYLNSSFNPANKTGVVHVYSERVCTYSSYYYASDFNSFAKHLVPFWLHCIWSINHCLCHDGLCP